MLGICVDEVLNLLSDAVWRCPGQVTEATAQLIDDARQRLGERVDLLVKDRDDQSDQTGECRQSQQQAEHRADRPRNPNPLQQAGERRQRRRDDHHDQHREHQRDDLFEDQPGHHQPEGEQHGAVESHRSDRRGRHYPTGCPERSNVTRSRVDWLGSGRTAASPR